MAVSTDNRRKDLARIHGLKNELGLDDYNYRVMLMSVTDKDSSAKMNAQEREQVIRQLQTLLGGVRKYYGGGDKGYAGHLTQKQANYISWLERELGWHDNASRLQGFIRRQIKRLRDDGVALNMMVSSMRNSEATRVITGLKKLLKDQE